MASKYHNLSNEALADEIGSVDAIAKAAEAELKALKDEFKARGERDSGYGDRKSGSHRAIPKLADLGISKTQSSRWQAFASLSPQAQESRIDSAKRQALSRLDGTAKEDKAARRAEREAELGKKQLDLPARKYGVIVADPGWRFEPWSRETGKRSAITSSNSRR